MLWVGAITTIVAIIVTVVVAIVVAIVVAVVVWKGHAVAGARSIGSVSTTLLRVRTGTGGSGAISVIRTKLTWGRGKGSSRTIRTTVRAMAWCTCVRSVIPKIGAVIGIIVCMRGPAALRATRTWSVVLAHLVIRCE